MIINDLKLAKHAAHITNSKTADSNERALLHNRAFQHNLRGISLHVLIGLLMQRRLQLFSAKLSVAFIYNYACCFVPGALQYKLHKTAPAHPVQMVLLALHNCTLDYWHHRVHNESKCNCSDHLDPI